VDKLSVRSYEKYGIVDITDLAKSLLERTAFTDGICYFFTPHSTCAVTTADLDPGTDADYALAATSLFQGITFNHPHNPEHFPAHFLGAAVGPSLAVPVKQGDFQLGEWQRMVLWEFDGPKERTIHVNFIPE
jgi:secondary thiamine-phosphate synthase enzyme